MIASIIGSTSILKNHWFPSMQLAIANNILVLYVLKVSQFFGLWNLLQGHDFPVKPLISSYD